MAVTFSKTRKVRLISKVNESRKEQVWWSVDELKNIRKQCSLAVRGCDSPSEPTICDEQSLRGLEYWSPKDYAQRRKTVRDAILVVLEEQQCQRLKGISEPFAFASVYASCAAEARENAYMVGVEDTMSCKGSQGEEERERRTVRGFKRNKHSFFTDTSTDIRGRGGPRVSPWLDKRRAVR